MAREGKEPLRKFLIAVVGLGVGVGLGALSTFGLQAQPQSIKRAVLVKSEKLTNIPGMDGYVVEVTLLPGAQSGWHIHPGHEFSYVLEGHGRLDVQGQPPQIIKKGEGVHIDPMTPHNGINTSKTAPLRLAVFYVLQSGKPLATPVAAPAK